MGIREELARKFVESTDFPTRGVIASGLTFRRLRKESRYEERIPSRRRGWEAKIYSEILGACFVSRLIPDRRALQSNIAAPAARMAAGINV